MNLVPVPDVIPIFPLPKTVLLPGEVLPLHVFEPRYRQMVRDALDSHGIIGMVQILPGHEREQPFDPPVHDVGCAGVIARHREMEDGRFLIWLIGVERFRITGELRTLTQYRVVSIAHEGSPEQEPHPGLGEQRLHLLASLTAYMDGKVEGGEIVVNDLARQLAQVGDEPLAAATAQIMGLMGERKQQLLEASDLEERYRVLQGELDLAVAGAGRLIEFKPKFLH